MGATSCGEKYAGYCGCLILQTNQTAASVLWSRHKCGVANCGPNQTAHRNAETLELAQIDLGSARDAIQLRLEVADSLELGSLTEGFRQSGSSPFLSPVYISLSSFPGGDEWESGGAISHVFAQRFAGDEHPPCMLFPSLSFCCARRSTPNPNKTVCIRI